MRAQTVCPTPGCGEIVDSGKCESCRDRDRRKRRKRRSSDPYGSRWRRVRSAFLSDHRTCECPECKRLPVVVRPEATDVHHVDGVVGEGHEGDKQLRAYAHGHHSRETARMQPGGWNAVRSRDRVRADRLVDAHNPDRSTRRTGQ